MCRSDVIRKKRKQWRHHVVNEVLNFLFQDPLVATVYPARKVFPVLSGRKETGEIKGWRETSARREAAVHRVILA